MQKSYQRELTTDQLKVREIADQYVKVEENTQPLTQLVRFSFKSKRNLVSGKLPLDLRSFFCLITQTCYLLYACQLRKMNVWLGKECLGRPPRKGELIPMQQVYMEYILGKQFDRMSVEEQQGVSQRLVFVELTKSQHSFGDYMCDFIMRIKNSLRGSLQKARNTADVFYVRQMDGLVYIVQNFLLAQVKTISPKIFILCLEESQAFREYSLLLKCFNNSLFASLRMFPQCSAIFRELLRIDQTLNVAAQQKRDFTENAKRVEMSIEQSFKFILKHKIIASQLSLTESSGQTNKGKEYTLGEIEGQTMESRKYTVRVYIRQCPYKKFSASTMQTILERIATLQNKNMDLQQLREEKDKKLSEGLKEQDKSLKSQYIVEYYSNKNLICVKYVTNIELNIENTDLLMFHCNYMSYQWHSVTLEFAEKVTSKNKKKERLLVFKTVTYLSLQDRAIFKIFAMIDLIMVYAKIVEPQLRKSIYNLEEYHNKNSELNMQCEHVKQIFIKKIEKTYRTLISK